MFLNRRLFSEARTPNVFGLSLVFAAGMMSGAALWTAPPSAAPAQPQADPSSPSVQDVRLPTGGHPAEVLRVTDGDTFEARVHIWPGMQITTKVRLRGIDAAEFRARCVEEARLATAAREAWQRLLAAGGVSVSRVEIDKYGGRVVASAATRRTPDLSEALLKLGVVRAYDGGRREPWCESPMR